MMNLFISYKTDLKTQVISDNWVKLNAYHYGLSIYSLNDTEAYFDVKNNLTYLTVKNVTEEIVQNVKKDSRYTVYDKLVFSEKTKNINNG